jgi:septum site-determining protein MinC
VVVDFEGRRIDGDLLCLVMKRLIWPLGIKVAAWRSLHGESLDLLKGAGLPVEEPRFNLPNRQPQSGQLPAMRLRRSLRSGQKVEHRGDVIVEGNVNDGAEVLAEGSVVVLGRLQGLVHAGTGGDEEAAVYARVFEAPQVRICFKVGSMDRSDPWWGRPAVVSLEDGVVVVSQWPQV